MTRNPLLPRPTLSARRLGNWLAIGSIGLAAACVTVHVNFPESAVNRAADDFVGDLYNKPTKVADADEPGDSESGAAMKRKIKKKTAPASKKTAPAVAPASAPEPTTLHWNFSVMNAAHAEDLMFSDAAAAAKKRMVARANGRPDENHAKPWVGLNALKSQGKVCESEDGFVVDKTKGKDPLIAKEVADEIQDRKTLYSELSKSLSYTEAQVREKFGGKIRAAAPPSHLCKPGT